MLGGVVGRHMSIRRRESSPSVPNPGGPGSPRYRRRRRAVTTSDHKTCALIQTRIKLGDIIMWVFKIILSRRVSYNRCSNATRQIIVYTQVICRYLFFDPNEFNAFYFGFVKRTYSYLQKKKCRLKNIYLYEIYRVLYQLNSILLN